MFPAGLLHVAKPMAVLYGVLVGCSTLSPSEPLPYQANSLASIRSVTLMSPNVNVFRQEVAPGGVPSEVPIPDATGKALRNIERSVQKHFEKLFEVKQPDLSQSTDALLFVSASDEIKTTSRRAMDTLGLAYGALLLPLINTTVAPMVLIFNPKADIGQLNRGMLKVMWPAGLTTFKAKLVRPGSEDILWSFTKESRGSYDLRERASVDALVAEAVEDLMQRISLTLSKPSG